MAQQDFPRIQSEIKLGAPATTDEFEITEGGGAKIERTPATIEDFTVAHCVGTKLCGPATIDIPPNPRLSPPLSSRIRKNEQNETSFLRETEAEPPA